MMEEIRIYQSYFSAVAIPLIVISIPLYGMFRRVPVYESFVEGAKEGFKVGVMIIPYLVAIFVAINMFRASGAMGAMEDFLRPALTLIGFPPEVLPMAIIRPLTGGGSAGVVADLAQQHGMDSIITRMAGTMFGSTETTFYILAVYFGAVNVKKTRHALPAGLIADVVAIFLSVYIVQWWFG
jgi:spore maturation protein B